MKWCSRLLIAAVLAAAVTTGAFAQEYQQALPDEPGAVVPQSVNAAVKPTKPVSLFQNKAKKKVASVKPTMMSSSDSQIAVLMSKVMQLNKDVSLFQQDSSQRLDNMKDSETQLSQSVQKLQQVMQMFDKQVQNLQAEQQLLTKNQARLAQVHPVSSVPPAWTSSALYGAMVLVILMMLTLLWRIRPKRRRVSAKNKPAEAGAEFDFMATSEAIPAKLDLACAYLAMEDFESARNVVAEVVNKGTEEQKQQAQSLLKDIDSKQQAK